MAWADPLGTGGWERQHNMMGEAQPGLELWQVKTQDRTEPRSLPALGVGRCPGLSARGQGERNLCL